MTEILETFPRVFCFPKSRINESGGNFLNITLASILPFQSALELSLYINFNL